MGLVLRWAILALGIALSARLVPGISYRDGETLVVVVVLLGLFNAFLKPVLVLFSLPFIVISLGLGIWLINALLIYWASKLVDGFYVHSFGAALWAALIVSLTNFLVSRLFSKPRGGPPRSPPRKHDDVIDI